MSATIERIDVELPAVIMAGEEVPIRIVALGAEGAEVVLGIRYFAGPADAIVLRPWGGEAIEVPISDRPVPVGTMREVQPGVYEFSGYVVFPEAGSYQLIIAAGVPVAVVVMAVGDGAELSVRCTDVETGKTYTTPFSFEPPEMGRVYAFESPAWVGEYGFVGVDNGFVHEHRGDTVVWGFLADRPKTVVLRYSRRAPLLVVDNGRYGRIVVWDAYLDVDRKEVGILFELVESEHPEYGFHGVCFDAIYTEPVRVLSEWGFYVWTNREEIGCYRPTGPGNTAWAKKRLLSTKIDHVEVIAVISWAPPPSMVVVGRIPGDRIRKI